MLKVSVVIVTKDRSNQLTHCLGSLAGQSQKLDELVVVDNNSSDTTSLRVQHFIKNSLFPVRLVNERKIGFPVVYNRGLKEAKYPWVAFIDDDCVADRDWFANIKKAILKNTKVAAILGQSKTLNSQNVYSLATLFFDEIWKQCSIRDTKILDTEILDNKNLVYNKKFLIENKLSYDETRINRYNGASEDCDLGMEIGRAGGEALYDKDILVFHKDPDSFSWYYKKLLWGTRAHLTYEKKWRKERNQTSSYFKKIIGIFRYFVEFVGNENVSGIKKFSLLLHIFLSGFVMSLIRLFEKIK